MRKPREVLADHIARDLTGAAGERFTRNAGRPPSAGELRAETLALLNEVWSVRTGAVERHLLAVAADRLGLIPEAVSDA